MPRAFPASPIDAHGTQADTGDWRALRGELAALLDHVDTRFGLPPHDDAGDDQRAPQRSPLREDAVQPEPALRHRAALRSVARAIDRFSERDDVEAAPANPQDTLRAAIQEIRARQGRGRPSQGEPPPLSELARTIGGLSARLERLETMLRAQHQSAGSLREIGEQVAQLTDVVELLAGAVGDTGHGRRLEDQIAALALTVERLAERQGQTAGSVSDAPDTITAGMRAVEHSVREVYDRIDALERNLTLPPADFEKLTEDMASVTEALHRIDQQPDRLMALVEALDRRVGAMETRDSGDIAGLQQDVGSLRAAVIGAVEPRFVAIEAQLETLSDQIIEGRQPDASVAQIEAQLRLLVARMDETGDRLNGLAELYSQPAPAAAAAPALSEGSIAELEARMARLFGQSRGGEDFSDVQNGIRKVDERLDRLEATLAQRYRSEAAEPAQLADDAVDADDDIIDISAAEVAETPAIRTPNPAADVMPRNPGDDAPLTELRFTGSGLTQAGPGPGPDTSAIDDAFAAIINPAPRQPQPVDAVLAELGARAGQPSPQPLAAADLRPPRPQSSLGEPIDVGTRSQPVEKASRNTFIAAHRRAQRYKAEAAEASANSVIGRALARFHNADEPAAGTAVAVIPAAAGRKRHNDPAPADAAATPATAAPSGKKPRLGKPSILSRHRRPLLLTVGLVALSMLTVNLITQRMGEAGPTASADASAATAATSAEPETATLPAVPQAAAAAAPGLKGDPLPGAAIDTNPVGAIDPALTLNLANPPMAPKMPDALQPVSLGPEILAPEAINSPVEVELPPDGLGPLPLRQAAAEGDARAQFEVAAIYTEGRAVPLDYAAAAIWYERAAAQGFAPAQYRLASLYEHGNGVSKDLEQARLWYQRAAEAGNRMSMHNLAALYAGGDLGEQNFAAAAEWFDRAAQRGLADSQFNLGMLHARGLGVPQDSEQSYKWFSLAANHGDADAAKARDEMAKAIDATAMQRLTEELAAWKTTPLDLAANFAPIGTWSPDFDGGAAIDNPEVVKKVQAALARLGYDIGTPDGMTGPKTIAAIKTFEKGTGMRETGAVNPRLLAVLGSQPV